LAIDLGEDIIVDRWGGRSTDELYCCAFLDGNLDLIEDLLEGREFSGINTGD
jgi:hypothetical protein